MADFFKALDQFPVELKKWLMTLLAGFLPDWAEPLVSAAISIAPILAVFPLMFGSWPHPKPHRAEPRGHPPHEHPARGLRPVHRRRH
jgi:hypothetical protein